MSRGIEPLTEAFAAPLTGEWFVAVVHFQDMLLEVCLLGKRLVAALVLAVVRLFTSMGSDVVKELGNVGDVAVTAFLASRLAELTLEEAISSAIRFLEELIHLVLGAERQRMVVLLRRL